MKQFTPDKQGFYGEFGGAFIPEMLYKNVLELQQNYRKNNSIKRVSEGI
jgi:tryptophan synthase beta chain